MLVYGKQQDLVTMIALLSLDFTAAVSLQHMCNGAPTVVVTCNGTQPGGLIRCLLCRLHRNRGCKRRRFRM